MYLNLIQFIATLILWIPVAALHYKYWKLNGKITQRVKNGGVIFAPLIRLLQQVFVDKFLELDLSLNC